MESCKSDRQITEHQDGKMMPLSSLVSCISRLTESKYSSSSDTSTYSVPTVPTPIDFDNFLPWVCRKCSLLQNVTVVRITQEEYRQNFKFSDDLHVSSTSAPREEVKADIVIQSHYNARNQLKEISFVHCDKGIPRQVIRAINLCLPFHSKLKRLNIRKGCLTDCSTLYEITKILPFSNITVLCLDGSVIVQGNYNLLLQETSKLSYLSLNRCKIDDDVCKEIANRLMYGEPAANSLNALELAINDITDTGAQYLGTMLRTNRKLLHLNLASNKITEDGGVALVTPLMKFSLTYDEALEIKKKRFAYLRKQPSILKSRTTLNETCDNVPGLYLRPSMFSISSRKSRKARLSVKQQSNQNDNLYFLDPYNITNLIIRKGCYFDEGNFTLCSLNLAYNALHYPFLQKLDKVLVYQQHYFTIAPDIGLIRVILDGNYMPIACAELDRIASCLKFKIDKRQPLPKEKRRHFSSISKKSLIRTRFSLK